MKDVLVIGGASPERSGDLADQAKTLLELHKPGDPVVLPTVWDAWSASVAADAGFPALTVGSHPLAHSRGRADREDMPFDRVLDRVSQITAAVAVPVSVDVESCYGLDAHDMIGRLLNAGAVGLNVEDTVHREGHRLRSSSEQAALVAALRAASDRTGVHVVINARTDVILYQHGGESDRIDRAISRLQEAADAGADCLYPIGFHDPDTHHRLAAELPLPVNAVAKPDVDDRDTLAAFGVGRISFGPFLQTALTAGAHQLLGRWL
jgi:2-methylisocitrate lyase-like PEP mutase family enzyme